MRSSLPRGPRPVDDDLLVNADPTGRILVLRLNRLGHVPPALYAAKALRQAGLQPLIFEFGRQKEIARTCVRDGLVRIRFSAPYVNLLPAPVRSGLLFLSALLYLGKLCFVQRPALLVAHGLQEQTMAWCLNFFLKIDYVVHVHEVYDDKKKVNLGNTNRFFLRFERAALRAAIFLIFPEERRASFYRSRYQLRQRIFIVYNCPPRRPAPPPSPAASPKRMIYLGGIGDKNCIDLAIRALPEIPDLNFFVFGWGNPCFIAELRALAVSLGVQARVFFPGELTNENQKWEQLEKSHLAYCVYAPGELRLEHVATASNKVMEAMAAGVPVVVPDRPDFQALVAQENLGICVPLRPTALAREINCLLAKPATLAFLRANALRRHQAVYHFEHQFHEVLRKFQEELQIRAPAPSRAPRAELEISHEI